VQSLQHIQLRGYATKPAPYGAQHKNGALYGAVGYNEAMYNEGESYAILDGSTQIEPIALAEKLIAKWEKLFVENSL